MWAAIGIITSVVVGPLLAFFIARWLEKKAADAAAEVRQKAEAAAQVEGEKKLANDTRTVNQSIDAQREARKNYLKGGGQ